MHDAIRPTLPVGAPNRYAATSALDGASAFFDFRTGTLHDAKVWAVEWSAADPDAPHPSWVMSLLVAPWPTDLKAPARTLPLIDAFVVAWETATIAETNRAALHAPAQLGLVLGDAYDEAVSPAEVARLMLALSRAYAKLGRVPTLRDVQRRRVDLPTADEFDGLGGFQAAVRRFRAELGVVA